LVRHRSCGAGTPLAGPLFASLKGSSKGEALVYDRRLEIKNNTLETPLVLTGRGECSSAPRTFLNAHTCVVGKESCTTRSYTSSQFRLSEQNVLQFYRRAGLYVYVIANLRHAEETLSPCMGSQSRFIRRLYSAQQCNDRLNTATRDIIAAALKDGIKHDNQQIRDITVTNGVVGCSAPVGATVLVAGECWEHVHSLAGNVYDFTTWAGDHSGNTAAAARGNPWPIKKHAWRGSHTLPFPRSHPVDRFLTAVRPTITTTPQPTSIWGGRVGSFSASQ